MSDTEDIVAQLRAWASTICSIRGDATPGRKSQMVRDAADEIERLRTERDEARREVSYMRPSVCLGAQTANEYSRERGWDCFKEEK
jgi:hypothetical protein